MSINPVERKIIHIDADCFFAAIEMRDNPALRDIPLAVGGAVANRGVISTCNYLARSYGVRSAMASSEALRLCPALRIIPGNYEKYQQASAAMREIFHDYTELVEPLSLDEAYLDVTHCCNDQGGAIVIAEEIRARIVKRLAITVSAGVAPNKFLAKVASDWRKPNGLTVIQSHQVAEFVRRLPVAKVWGIGKVTAAKLRRVDIRTCGDLQALSHSELAELFGTFATRLYGVCRGVDDRKVEPSRRRKSLSVEHTYATNLPDLNACMLKVPMLLDELSMRLSDCITRHPEEAYRVAKVFIKMRFADFSSTTVEHVHQRPELDDYQQLCSEAFVRGAQPVRLLGVGVRFAEPVIPVIGEVSSLPMVTDVGQLSLFLAIE